MSNEAPNEFPKWVEVHASHVQRVNNGIAVPLFPEFHVARDGTITVIVRNKDEEAKALGVEEHPTQLPE